jgi:hypothetical protein
MLGFQSSRRDVGNMRGLRAIEKVGVSGGLLPVLWDLDFGSS